MNKITQYIQTFSSFYNIIYMVSELVQQFFFTENQFQISPKISPRIIHIQSPRISSKIKSTHQSSLHNLHLFFQNPVFIKVQSRSVKHIPVYLSLISSHNGSKQSITNSIYPWQRNSQFQHRLFQTKHLQSLLFSSLRSPRINPHFQTLEWE